MSVSSDLKVVTAKRVRDGKTVYLTECDMWTPDLEIAHFLEEDDHDWRLAFANRLQEVEGANLINVPESALIHTAA